MELPTASALSELKLWSSNRVAQWLVQNGFKEFKALFLKHEITGDLLLDLNYQTLGEIGVISPADRARILQIIKKNFAPTSPRLPNASFRSAANINGSKKGQVLMQKGQVLMQKGINGRYLSRLYFKC